MDAPSSGLKLREEVSARFPADAAQVTARVAELGYEPDALTAWFELFSQRTTEAMRSRDEALVRSHLDFMAEKLVTANTEILEYIDTYYVEVLMWNLDVVSKKWGWQLVPNNLKELYVKAWGEPSF